MNFNSRASSLGQFYRLSNMRSRDAAENKRMDVYLAVQYAKPLTRPVGHDDKVIKICVFEDYDGKRALPVHLTLEHAQDLVAELQEAINQAKESK